MTFRDSSGRSTYGSETSWIVGAANARFSRKELLNEREGNWILPTGKEIDRDEGAVSWLERNSTADFPFTDSELLSDSDQALEELLMRAYDSLGEDS